VSVEERGGSKVIRPTPAMRDCLRLTDTQRKDGEMVPIAGPSGDGVGRPGVHPPHGAPPATFESRRRRHRHVCLVASRQVVSGAGAPNAQFVAGCCGHRTAACVIGGFGSVAASGRQTVDGRRRCSGAVVGKRGHGEDVRSPYASGCPAGTLWQRPWHPRTIDTDNRHAGNDHRVPDIQDVG
jgi:hypothetical protein